MAGAWHTGQDFIADMMIGVRLVIGKRVQMIFGFKNGTKWYPPWFPVYSYEHSAKSIVKCQYKEGWQQGCMMVAEMASTK